MSFNFLWVNFLAFLLPAALGALLVQGLGINREEKNFEPTFVKATTLGALVTAILVIILSIEYVLGIVVGIILGAAFEIVRDSMAEKKSMAYRIAQVKKAKRNN